VYPDGKTWLAVCPLAERAGVGAPEILSSDPVVEGEASPKDFTELLVVPSCEEGETMCKEDFEYLGSTTDIISLFVLAGSTSRGMVVAKPGRSFVSASVFTRSSSTAEVVFVHLTLPPCSMASIFTKSV